MGAAGVIGLGAMGAPIAGHLVAHGHQVTGFDIVSARVDTLRKHGGRGAQSAREVAAHSELTLVVLVDDAQVIEACLGPDGVLEGAGRDSVIAILSSVSPETCQEVHRRAAVKGVHVLDAPMIRGEAAAQAGRLLLMVGGEERVVSRCRPMFEAFASDLCHLGAVGAGAVGKIVNNMLLWAAVSANHEAIHFGRAFGLDPRVLREGLQLSSGDNWALREWERITAQPKWWDQKDLEGALALAEQKALSMPLMRLVKDVMKPLRPANAKRLFIT